MTDAPTGFALVKARFAAWLFRRVMAPVLMWLNPRGCYILNVTIRGGEIDFSATTHSYIHVKEASGLRMPIRFPLAEDIPISGIKSPVLEIVPFTPDDETKEPRHG